MAVLAKVSTLRERLPSVLVASRFTHSQTRGKMTSPELLAQGNCAYGNSNLEKMPRTINTNMCLAMVGSGTDCPSEICSCSKLSPRYYPRVLTQAWQRHNTTLTITDPLRPRI